MQSEITSCTLLVFRKRNFSRCPKISKDYCRHLQRCCFSFFNNSAEAMWLIGDDLKRWVCLRISGRHNNTPHTKIQKQRTPYTITLKGNATLNFLSPLFIKKFHKYPTPHNTWLITKERRKQIARQGRRKISSTIK